MDNEVIRANRLVLLTLEYTRKFVTLFQFRGRYRIAAIITSICLPKKKALLPHINNGLMVFDLKNKHEVSMFYDLFCSELSGVLKDFLKPNDIFIDCGSNIGYFTFMSASLLEASSGKVISIDANPYCIDRIKQSKDLGGYNNIEIIEGAVGEHKGELEFNIADDPMYSSISDLNQLSFTKTNVTIKVPVYTMDEILHDYIDDKKQSIRLIKIDVEGAEIDVLKGMSHTLEASLIEYIFIEIHPQQIMARGQNHTEVNELIERYGYEVEKRFGEWSYLYRQRRKAINQ